MGGAMAQFPTSYCDDAVYRLPALLRVAKKDLAEVDFDTIVGTGFSGAMVIPALAMRMRKKFVLIRKDNDDSHHGGGRLVGELGARWIFLDDFCSSGATRKRVIEKIDEAVLTRNLEDVVHVGSYYYSGFAWRDKGVFHRA